MKIFSPSRAMSRATDGPAWATVERTCSTPCTGVPLMASNTSPGCTPAMAAGPRTSSITSPPPTPAARASAGASGRSAIVSKSKAAKLFPQLNLDGYVAAVIYSDGQFNDARMAVTLARTAAWYRAWQADTQPPSRQQLADYVEDAARGNAAWVAP